MALQLLEMKPPTSIFDPLLEQMARDAGVSVDKLSNIIGGNIEGALLTIPADILLTKLGAKLAELFGGGLGLYYSLTGLKGRGRLQDDGIQISSRVISAVLDPTADDIKELQADWGRFWQGLITLNVGEVLWSLIRPPSTYIPTLQQSPRTGGGSPYTGGTPSGRQPASRVQYM